MYKGHKRMKEKKKETNLFILTLEQPLLFYLDTVLGVVRIADRRQVAVQLWYQNLDKFDQ